MNRCLLSVVWAALVVVGTTPAKGEWASWNPFSKPASSGSSTSWFASWGKSSAPRKGPTTWQRVQSAPSNMMSKTKSTLSPLNPFKTASTPAKPASFLGSSNARKKAAKSNSWLPSWSSEETEKDAPITVSDWLDAPRPE